MNKARAIIAAIVLAVLSGCATSADDPQLRNIKAMASQLSCGAAEPAVSNEIKGLIIAKALPLARPAFQKLLDGYVKQGYITQWQDDKLMDLFDKAVAEMGAVK